MFEHCYLHAYNSRRGVTTFSIFWHGRLRCLNVALILFHIFGPLLVPPISRTLSRLKRIRADFALPLPASKMSITMIHALRDAALDRTLATLAATCGDKNLFCVLPT